MKLVKRKNSGNPFYELETLHNEINNLFDWTFPSFFSNVADNAVSKGWLPAIDVYENNENVMIKVDVPGIDKKDLHVSISDDTLVISGEKKEVKDVNERGFFRAERTYGSFHRTIALPSYVDHAKAKAEYKDGTLTLTVPHKEAAKPKQISVDIK